MSESKDPPAPPPEDQPDRGSFPESSLTPPPEPPPPPEVPATAWSESPPEPPAPPPEPPPAEPARPWMEPSAPAQDPWSAAEAPGAPPSAMPSPGGMMSGDPLAGPPPATGSAFPPGYTSPPPPGAGGQGSPPWSPDAHAPVPGFAPGTFVLAGWWRRVGAAVIDGLLIGVVAMVLMAPLGIGIFSSDGSDSSIVALVLGFIVAGLVFAVVALAYAPVMMGKTNGKTVGRMATGIRVVRADGQAMTIGFAAVREVAVKALLIGTVAGSITFGLASLLDVLWPLWDDENRALHDFVVNTRVVMD